MLQIQGLVRTMRRSVRVLMAILMMMKMMAIVAIMAILMVISLTGGNKCRSWTTERNQEQNLDAVPPNDCLTLSHIVGEIKLVGETKILGYIVGENQIVGETKDYGRN